jgi:hypothetical protein
MADTAGRLGKIDVSDDGAAYVDLGGVKDFSNPFDRDTIETTDFDSAGWKESLAGIGNATVSATMNWDEADAGQIKLLAANQNATPIWFRWRPTGDGSGQKEVIMKCNLTSFESSASVDGVLELSSEAEMTGAPTIQNQP